MEPIVKCNVNCDLKPKLLSLYMKRSNRLRHATQRKLGSAYEPWLLSMVHSHAISVALYF